jgi:hypothetical protein
MANDEREEEREFLEGLKARTGRDLAEWMAAIAAQGFHDKNEIIDWLRNEGLPFARASWLERIHRNAGEPIHAGGAAASPKGSDPAPRRSPGPPPAKPPPEPAEKAPPLVEASSDAGALERLLAAAKGYRPLFHHLEAQIRRAIPGAIVAPRDRYVSIGAPREFAAVTLHPTEIRLGLDLGDRPFAAQLQKAKLRGPGRAITHMVSLTDARQVDGALLALIEAANARVNAAEA